LPVVGCSNLPERDTTDAEVPGALDGTTAPDAGNASRATRPAPGVPDSAEERAECTRDADCAGVDCNAPARCEAGRCARGRPCENPDPDHCAVECVKTPGAARCVVSGVDRDGDGHGDQRCDAAPGDDCDDTESSVHAGAPERCDGLDNDCNGKVDVDDGLPLAGANVLVKELAGPGSVALAKAGADLALAYGLRDQDGAQWQSPVLAILGADGPVERESDVSELVFVEPVLRGTPDAVWVGGMDPAAGRFAVRELPQHDGGSPSLTLVSATPVTSFALSPIAPSGGIEAVWVRSIDAPSAAGGIVAAPIRAGEVGSPEALSAPTPTSNVDTHVAVASNQNRLAVAWLRQGLPSPTSRGFRLTTSVRALVANFATNGDGGAPAAGENELVATAREYTGMADLEAALVAQRPQIEWSGDHFVVAWFDTDALLNVTSLTEGGAVTCGPVVFSGVTGVTNAAHAVARADGSVLLTYADPSGAAMLVRLDGHCRLVGAPIAVTAPDRELARGPLADQGLYRLASGEPAITSTDDGFAFAWIERPRRAAPDGGIGGDAGTAPAPPPYELVVRHVGKRLCD
jgi:hypothetical protein